MSPGTPWDLSCGLIIQERRSSDGDTKLFHGLDQVLMTQVRLELLHLLLLQIDIFNFVENFAKLGLYHDTDHLVDSLVR